ncbi:MAG: serine/threonine protein kinase [Planctomycetes bacterium]|nr:serine/threonine protein kinase [Planctomycetota bacterium]
MQAPEIHKQDALGRVERVEIDGSACARRVASGNRLPGSGWLARRLLARERRALRALAGLAGVPRLLSRAAGDEALDVLLRDWVSGVPLSRAGELPADFFDHLDTLVQAVHARGVCHNDLHKESNVLVGADGYPWLIDFQLASRHPRGGRAFEVRAREDLRHVEKHRRRYTRHGRGPGGVELVGAGAGIRRSPLARAWRRVGKPVYVALTRGVLGTRDGGDAQRSPQGPWPAWTPPSGPRPQSTSSR